LLTQINLCRMVAMLITVTSHKGGVGKTVSAIHLAAFFVREFGEGSTVLVDTDPNGSALEWAQRGKLPFPVVEPQAEPGDEEHVVLDSQGRLHGEDLEVAVEESDLLVVPTTPEALALNALMLFVEDLERIGRRTDYRVLLTMVPWWNLSGMRARKALEAEGVPLFEGEIRRREAFQAAALRGVPIYDVNERRARQGWEDYEKVGREVLRLR
jgi:chromosome partitioning protein